MAPRFWIRRLLFLSALIAALVVAASQVPSVDRGLDRALKPARDLTGWIGDNIDAKSERDDLAKQHDALETQLLSLQGMSVENAQLKAIITMNSDANLDRYGPVQARVTAEAPLFTPRHIRIDAGSADGVRAGQPVLNGDGLIGHVASVTPHSALATLIDESFATGAVVGGNDVKATVVSSVNHPDELELTLVNPSLVARGDDVVTQGPTTMDSFYPEGVPVGRVFRIDHGDGDLDERIRVRPFADLHDLDRIEVLTRVSGV
jgi:rod shape-determining protein MreC